MSFAKEETWILRPAFITKAPLASCGTNSPWKPRNAIKEAIFYLVPEISPVMARRREPRIDGLSW
jgi:hypothetical protein